MQNVRKLLKQGCPKGSEIIRAAYNDPYDEMEGGGVQKGFLSPVGRSHNKIQALGATFIGLSFKVFVVFV